MMKKGANYAIAAIIFILTMALLNGGSIILALGASLGGAMIGGEAGIEGAYNFLLDNLNLLSCLMYLIPGVVFILWYYFAFVENQGTTAFLRAQTKRLSASCFGWLVILTFAVQHAVSLLMAIVAVLLPSAMESYTEMVDSSGLTQYSVMWVIATVILPPLVEETIFRGLIIQYLKRAGAGFLVVNLIQAVLFGIFHMNLIQGIYATALGFVLGYLAYRYDSLIVPMVMHALFNLFGTVVVALESRILPEIMLGMLVVGSVPVTVAVLVLMHYGVGEPKKLSENREKRPK